MELDSKEDDDGPWITESQETMPLFIVDTVDPGSPAQLAGLREADEIMEFGSVNRGNFRNLMQIAEVARNRRNQQIVVKARRNSRMHDLILIPKVWAGQGLMGCHIIPVPGECSAQN